MFYVGVWADGLDYCDVQFAYDPVANTGRPLIQWLSVPYADVGVYPVQTLKPAPDLNYEAHNVPTLTYRWSSSLLITC